MSYSTNDELEQIERAARSTSPMPGGEAAPAPAPAPMPAPAPAPKGRRRGSSTFTMPKGGANVDYRAKPAVVPVPPPPVSGDALLEPFGTRGTEKPSLTEVDSYQPPAPVVRPPAPAVAPKRGSVVMKPMAGIGGLVDFDDSDFDDSDEDDDDDDDNERLPGKPMPGASSGAAVGGPNHRPLVGGFAAAAYEAARAHHYANINKGKEKVAIPKRAGPPPSI